MENAHYFRINIEFLEPDKLTSEFFKVHQKELRDHEIYLGIRANPALKNQSAAINSIELAYQYMEHAKEELYEKYGRVNLFPKDFNCPTEYMASIVDIDSRTIAQYLHDHPAPHKRKKKQASVMSMVRSMIGIK